MSTSNKVDVLFSKYKPRPSNDSYFTDRRTPIAFAVPAPANKATTSNRAENELVGEHAIPYTPTYIQSPSIDEHQMRQLTDQGFTSGLARSFAKNNDAFPLRIWVLDNSISMNKPDGHRIVDTASRANVKIVPCTRWEEIRECSIYHIKLASLLKAPTHFRLLNNPGSSESQFFGVAETPDSIGEDESTAIRIIRSYGPSGCTPLSNHIHEIHRSVKSMSQDLENAGQRVVIVIATDGLPTDVWGFDGELQQQEFVESLRLLEGLPVWVVIRLCTDEDEVVNFYNDLDQQLELSMEVLDDFCGEALEIYEHNSWLNYALPLHRCREMGFHDRVFDLLDERTLTRTELRDFCLLLFGADQFDGVPDPSVDWKGFSHEVERMLKREKQQWNPVKKVLTPWIDMKKLNRQYDSGAGCAPAGCSIM
jgi:hypothetical protein